MCEPDVSIILITTILLQLFVGGNYCRMVPIAKWFLKVTLE